MIFFVILAAVLIAIAVFSALHSRNSSVSSPPPTQKTVPVPKALAFPDDARSLISAFAQMTQAIITHPFFHASPDYDKILILFSMDEGDSCAHVELSLYVNCNLNDIFKSIGLRLDSPPFKFDGHDTLCYESDSIHGMYEWLGFIDAKKRMKNQQTSIEFPLFPLTAAIQNNLPCARLEEATGGYSWNSKKENYTCAGYASFRLSPK